MRLRAALLALLVVLAGCSGLSGDPATTTAEPTTTAPGTTTAAPTTTTTTTTASPTTTESGPTFDFADPPSDRLGWEDGVWANESLAVTNGDGLNETELDLVAARAMARVEVVRGLEFTETVNITVQSREWYADQVGGSNYGADFRTFDNTKFEAMFLIGEDEDALAVQEANRGSSVLGFYSPAEEAIVVIADTDTPSLNGEGTLAHELLHAAQDQYWELSSFERPTRESYNAQNGLIEGDANFVQRRYMARCGGEWECLPSSGGGGGGDLANIGVYILEYFPYSDGPGFVKYQYDRGGWDAVNALYDDPPASTEQVIYPSLYGQDSPQSVSLTDRNRNGWTRVRPAERTDSARPDYAVLGQSALSTMFAYTLYNANENRAPLVSPNEFLNRGPDGRINSSDPLNYGLAVTEGWDGDRMHIYQKDNESAYVWRIVWDTDADARRFAGDYGTLLAFWGGSEVSADTYVIDSGPFADAFRVTVEGDTVTIVNAPTVEALDDVRR